jgi:hypothetical protein
MSSPEHGGASRVASEGHPGIAGFPSVQDAVSAPRKHARRSAAIRYGIAVVRAIVTSFARVQDPVATGRYRARRRAARGLGSLVARFAGVDHTVTAGGEKARRPASIGERIAVAGPLVALLPEAGRVSAVPARREATPQGTRVGADVAVGRPVIAVFPRLKHPVTAHRALDRDEPRGGSGSGRVQVPLEMDGHDVQPWRRRDEHVGHVAVRARQGNVILDQDASVPHR